MVMHVPMREALQEEKRLWLSVLLSILNVSTVTMDIPGYLRK